MAGGATSDKQVKDAIGCLILVSSGFIGWLAWTNRPIGLWCLATAIIGTIGWLSVPEVAEDETAGGRTGLAVAKALTKLSFAIAIASGIGWVAQILLNMFRDRADPNDVFVIEAFFYDAAAWLERMVSLPVIGLLFLLAIVAALVTNTWLPLRWSSRLKAWVSQAAVVLAGLASITFVGVDVGAKRQGFILGPIRATIGTDLTRLRDARRRIVAAQWLVAEIKREPIAWHVYAEDGLKTCARINEIYREDYAADAKIDGVSEEGSTARNLPCYDTGIAPAVAKSSIDAAPSKPSSSVPWLRDVQPLWGGEPPPVDDPDAVPPPPTPASPLNEATNTLSSSEMRRAALDLDKKAEAAEAVAQTWEDLASKMLGSLAGETDRDYRGMLVRTWVDLIVEHIAAESGESIARRLALLGEPPQTPRDAAAFLARLPAAAFPIMVEKIHNDRKELVRRLVRVWKIFLPDASQPKDIALLAAKEAGRRWAKENGKPIKLTDDKGNVVDVEQPPGGGWNDPPGGEGGIIVEPPRPEPRRDFRGVP